MSMSDLTAREWARAAADALGSRNSGGFAGVDHDQWRRVAIEDATVEALTAIALALTEPKPTCTRCGRPICNECGQPIDVIADAIVAEVQRSAGKGADADPLCTCEHPQSKHGELFHFYWNNGQEANGKPHCECKGFSPVVDSGPGCVCGHPKRIHEDFGCDAEIHEGDRPIRRCWCSYCVGASGDEAQP